VGDGALEDRRTRRNELLRVSDRERVVIAIDRSRGAAGCRAREARAIGPRIASHVRDRARARRQRLVLVAELAGHRRLETTRRYSLPSKADRQKAVTDLEIDF
jgi:hypothetical protein